MRNIQFRSVRVIRFLLLAVLVPAVSMQARGADTGAAGTTERANHPERVEWFSDLGFGLFIHWGLDSQLGGEFSRSMEGASDDFLRRYFEELPQTFNPEDFRPDTWAALAKLAGVKYVVFTAKDSSGFCMFETESTDFNIVNTPFRRDIVEEIVTRFRAYGIAPGLSFSPDDSWWRHRQGTPAPRQASEIPPQNDPGLIAHQQAQLTELLNDYGPIDILIIDGNSDRLRNVAWEIDPYTVVSGPQGMAESDVSAEGAGQLIVPLGAQPGGSPAGETLKSGAEVIALLIETRAQGGNLLLEVAPRPSGELPMEQEERLREVARWMFINQECIYSVRPWVVDHEGPVWFTKARDADTVYAIIKQEPSWAHGAARDFVLHSVRATSETTVSILGQNSVGSENARPVAAMTTFEQQADGLHVHAVRTQHIDNGSQWPHPVVIKLTHVEPALTPPRMATTATGWNDVTGQAVVEGEALPRGEVNEQE